MFDGFEERGTGSNSGPTSVCAGKVTGQSMSELESASRSEEVLGWEEVEEVVLDSCALGMVWVKRMARLAAVTHSPAKDVCPVRRADGYTLESLVEDELVLA